MHFFYYAMSYKCVLVGSGANATGVISQTIAAEWNGHLPFLG